MSEQEQDLDELLGRTRCARCGQVLDGQIECPFCSIFPDPPRAQRLPTWVFFTACFLTSPLSLPVILTTRRLTGFQKVLATSGLFGWLGLWWV
ncbi:MAG TPA: hypothetical protein VFN94_11320 [Nitrospiria bacterium]|nr:hypothetical protein [Nitrospiria bacterium]